CAGHDRLVREKSLGRLSALILRMRRHDFLPTSEESDASKQQNTIIGSVGAFLRSFLPPARAGQYSDRAIADYPNAIAWSVDEFFRNLLPAVDLSKTLIIYTSDHGQSLLPGHFTHCSITACGS